MKNALLCCILQSCSVFTAISSFGAESAVDYDKMESLVTNRLVMIDNAEMRQGCLTYIKQQTGADDFDIVCCLGRYIRKHSYANPGQFEYGRCRTAMWLFAEIANDEQMNELIEVAETQENRTAQLALRYYYRRMRTKGGLERIERMLNREMLGTNMYAEVSSVLRLDAKDFWGRDNNHKSELERLARRQLAKRKHCRIFDEVLSSLDSKYAKSEQRRVLVEMAVSNQLLELTEKHKEYFLKEKKKMEQAEKEIK